MNNLTLFLVPFLVYLFLNVVKGQNMCPEVTGCYCQNSLDDVRVDCIETTWEFIPEDFPLNTTEIYITKSPLWILLSGNLSLYNELRNLNLRDNEMESVEVGAFQGVDLLEDLNLEANLLTEIKAGSFSNLKYLDRVFLSDNKLVGLPPFDEVTTLVYIALDYNNITSIHSNAFGSNTGLKSINLSYNKITSIATDAFKDLNNLENLFLDGNKIQALGQGTLNGLSGLITLSLMNNELSNLGSNSFQGTGQQLEYLYLGDNMISSIDENAFNGLTGLQFLQLEDNSLESVPTAAIKKITSLNSLDLSANLIAHIGDNAFTGLPKLNTLNIGLMNTLVNISEGAFNGMTNLTQLSLFSNKLLTVLTPAHFPDDEHYTLLSLRIYDNGFTSLKEEIFSGKENLQRVDLFYNPYHCDCKIGWMSRVVEEGVLWARHWDDEIPLLCESPDHLQTFEIPRMRDKDFTCLPPEVEGSSPETVVAYLHGNATLQGLAHNGIPATWWVSPSGVHYYPLRSIPPEYLISERISVSEVFENGPDETLVIGTLEFDNTTQSDAGIYTMWASNHVENVSIEIELVVLPYELTTVIATTSIMGGTSTLEINYFSILLVYIITAFINYYYVLI